VTTWSEELGQELQKRKIELVNLPKVERIEIKNKSIMNLA